MSSQDSEFQLVREKVSNSILHLKQHNFPCSKVEFNYRETSVVEFPNVGYIFLTFLNSENFQQEFLDLNMEERKPDIIYACGLLSRQSLRSRQKGCGTLYALKIHPVVAHRLLGIPMSSLTDRQVMLSEILFEEKEEIKKLECSGALSSLDSPVLKKLISKKLPDFKSMEEDTIYHAVNTIMEKKGDIRISALADQCHMSERTLNRHFLNKVGLPPKAYAKIWQWQHVTYLLQTENELTLEDLAVKAGYYDVAHLVNDFKTKLPQTPTQFLMNINPLIKDYLKFPNAP